MQLSRKVVSILSTFVLIFSMMAPSFVKANNEGFKRIIDLELPNDMEIQDIQLNMMGEYGAEIDFDYSWSNQQLTLEVFNYEELQSQLNYQGVYLMWTIKYTSNGENNIYYDTYLMNKQEFENISSYKMKENIVSYSFDYTKQLSREKIVLEVGNGYVNNMTEFNLQDDLQLNLVLPEDHSQRVQFNYFGDNPQLESAATKAPEQYNVYVTGGFYSNYTPVLNEYINFDLLDKLTFDEQIQNIEIKGGSDNSPSTPISNEMLSNTAHLNSKFKDATTNLSWSGLLVANGNKQLSLNLSNYNLNMPRTSQYENNGVLYIDNKFDIMAENAGYPVYLDKQSIPSMPFTIKLLNDKKEVVRAVPYTSENLAVQTNLDIFEEKNGYYSLEFSTEINGEVISTNNDYGFYYNNYQKPAKGTIFTFEGTDGKALTDGTLTIYGNNTIYSGESFNANKDGEFFIPKDRLKKDKKYTAFYYNEDKNIVYAQSFVGQQFGEYKFTADALKQLQFDTTGFITEKAYAEFSVAKYFGRTVALKEEALLYNSDVAISVDWTGTDAAKENYYSYIEEVTANGSLALSNVKWDTLQASTFHENAKFVSVEDSTAYKSINAGGKQHYLNQQFSLNVSDQAINYYVYFNLYGQFANTQIPAELATGYVFYKEGMDEIYTSYASSIHNAAFAEGENVQLNYELIKDGEVTKITSSNLDTISLQQKLAPGSYELKLVSHNLNKEILDLQLHQTFVVEAPKTSEEQVEEPGEDNANTDEKSPTIQLPNTIAFDLNSKVGQLSSNVSLSVNKVGDHLGFASNYYYQGNAFVYQYGNTIFREDTYDVTMKGFLIENGIVVNYHTQMTGEQLENLSKLELTEKVYPITVQLPKNENGESVYTAIYAGDNHIASNYDMQIDEANKGMILGTAGNYSLYATSMADEFIKISPTSTITVGEKSENNLSIKEVDYHKVQFVQGDTPLAIGQVPSGESGIFYPSLSDDRTTLYVPEDYNKDLMLGLMAPAKYEAPYLYTTVISKEDLKKDKVTVDLSKVNLSNHSITYDEEYRSLIVQYDVSAGNQEISSISSSKLSTWSEAVKRDSLLTHDGMPIRYATGNYYLSYGVETVISVIDSNGQEVYSSASQPYSFGYVYNSVYYGLEKGVYTVNVDVEVGADQYESFTETLNISGHDEAYVLTTSPKLDFVTKDSSITVEGEANENASLQLIATNNETNEQAATAEITATEEGTFSHTFESLAEGTYTITVLNGEEQSEVIIVIDQTAPKAVTNVNVEKTGSNLAVTWQAVDDAKSYEVSVLENGKVTKTSGKISATNWMYTNITPGKTYEFVIEAIDVAGNTSKSEAASYTVDPFIITNVEATVAKNKYGYAVIGDELAIAVEGSYDNGYQAKAIVHVNDATKEVELTYNKGKKRYEGALPLTQGMQTISAVDAVIIDGDNKTEKVSKALAVTIGATISGTLTDTENDLVKEATVYIRSVKDVFFTVTDAKGNFAFTGIPAGEYSVSVTKGNQSSALQKVQVNIGDLVENNSFVINAMGSIEAITFKVNGKEDTNLEYLYVTISNGKFVNYGQIVDGKFVSYNPTALKNIVAGEYKVTVEGQGLYETTVETINVTKAMKQFEMNVQKRDIENATITLNVGDVKELEYISLYSPSVNQQYNYTLGNYYLNNVKVVDGKVTIPAVVLAEDYSIYVSAENYIPFYANVDISSEKTIDVALEKGRQISGKFVDVENKAIQGVNVSTYIDGKYSSAVTNEKGEYTLTNVPTAAGLLDIIAEGYIVSGVIELAKGDKDVALETVTLSKAATLTGFVKDANGQPLSNVSIYVANKDEYKWARTAKDGSFAVTGLIDTQKYTVNIESYGYPTLIEKDVTVARNGETYVLQAIGEGDFAGEGNYLSASKTTVAPGEEIQYSVGYQNNGKHDSENVNIHINVPATVKLLADTVLLNGKPVTISAEGNVVVPSVAAGENGKVTFKVKVIEEIAEPSIFVTAKIAEIETIHTASTAVVFASLQAPSTTATTDVKVYGSAQYGSTIEVYANGKLVGTTKVDSKWWFADVTLPVADKAAAEKMTLTAIAKNNGKVAAATPVEIAYTPNIPTLKNVEIYAGWNGNVKLNPYTGVATFAITEHSSMPSTIEFSGDVASAKLIFLGEEYDMKKNGNKFTHNGSFGEDGLWTSYGEQLLQVAYTTKDGVTVTVPLMNIIVLIDPSGYIFEDSMDNRLEGVQAIVQVLKDNKWVAWNAEMFGQINPQISDEDGRYGWDVIEGKWRVIFSKEGYETYISRVMDVPPAETELNIPMVKTSNPTVTTTSVTSEQLTVTFDRYMNASTVDVKVLDAEGNEVKGSIEYKELNGYQSLQEVPSEKVTGFVSEDSFGEKGYFVEDENVKVANSFTFVPAEKLAADTTYTYVVSGTSADQQGRTIGEKVTLAFTTEKENEGNNLGEPEKPENPGEGSEPEQPSNPGTGGEVVGPNNPGEGSEVEQPSNPGNGGNTEEPSNPEVGGEVEQPNNPGEGSEVEQPSNPGNGGNTEEPSNPEVGGEVEQPSNPGTGGEAELPSNPETGSEQEQPAQPGEMTVDAEQIDTQGGKAIELNAQGITAENKQVAIHFTKEAIAKVVQSNKAVKLQVGDITVQIPQAVIKQAGQKETTFNIQLSEQKRPSSNLSTVSNVYSFTLTVDGKVLSTFDEAIEITLPLQKNVKDMGKVAVYYVNYDKNRYEYMLSKGQDGKVHFKTKHFSDYVVLEGNKAFQDTAQHWAKESIEQLASISIITGKTTTSFAPEDTITRAEFATLITRTLNLQNDKFTGVFKDVNKESLWYANDVEAAAKAKIILGVSEGVFDANALISREQMATMIVRAIEYVNASVIPSKVNGLQFADAASVSPYAVKNVNIASTLGIINGVNENGVRNFKPKNKASRAEAAAMLSRMIEQLQ